MVFFISVFQPCRSTAAGGQLAATTSEERAMMAAFRATTTAGGNFSRTDCPNSGERTINVIEDAQGLVYVELFTWNNLSILFCAALC